MELGVLIGQEFPQEVRDLLRAPACMRGTMNGKSRGRDLAVRLREGSSWMGLGLRHHPLRLRSGRKAIQEREHLIGSKEESGFCYELCSLFHALCRALP